MITYCQELSNLIHLMDARIKMAIKMQNSKLNKIMRVTLIVNVKGKLDLSTSTFLTNEFAETIYC